MTLQTSIRQGCLIVEMPPEVDIGNAEPLRQELRELCRTLLDPSSRDGVLSAVVVDWAAAPFLTMAGVAVLDDFRQQAGERGLPVRVVASHRWPRAVLRIVGLNGVLAIHDSVEQALTGDEAPEQGRRRPEIGKTS
ncbi:STAS domain-containing protein [Streptomyces sp. T-3]|nr:STAS domain-containing protein [Streptomyces sp. T-3]